MFKQVIVVRNDLGMSPGKLAAQVAHAAVSAYINALASHKDWASGWLMEGQKKVVLTVKNKDALIELYQEVKEEFPSELIVDAGRTELEPGTVTCLGIGPAPELELDRYTGRLPLLK